MAFLQKVREFLKKPQFSLGIILLVGSIVRLTALERFPMGLHQDEAYSAYNAYSIMKYGIDSAGYAYPVYYTVWGSGMSILYSYLTMPFFALFGVSTITIRLPQAILGSISLLAAYGLGKECKSKWFGVAFAGLLTITPWHIQQSRFGLDANTAVPMLLFALYFWCRYLNGKRHSLWLAAGFFGLTLYSYALAWPLVVAILLLSAVCFRKRIAWNRQLLGGTLFLFVLALPLLLFLAVNFGWIPEIQTRFLSIPKLSEIRVNEFSIRDIKQRFLWLTAMLFAQHDDIWYITDMTVGAFYYISTPFILFGILCHGKIFLEKIRKKKELPLHFIMALWGGAMFLEGCTISFAKYYKVNGLLIPCVFYGTYGIWNFCTLLKKWGNKYKYQEKVNKSNFSIKGFLNIIIMWMPKVIVIGYLGYFVYFLISQITYPVVYENYGNSYLSRMLWNEYEAAIEYAESLTEGDISIIDLNYANVMLYKKWHPMEYLKNVVYLGEDLAFRQVQSIGRYYFNRAEVEETNHLVYVIPYNMEDYYLEHNYLVEHVTPCYGVAYKEEKLQ